VSAGRVLHAGLALLDRQLIDRDGRRCGKVDDLELDEIPGSDGLFVTAILSGPGALLCRTGHVRAGMWMRSTIASVFPIGREDPVRIPVEHVADIGSHVRLGLDAAELATSATERWFRDHVISHIPGSDVDAAG
jgi:sporulation protein YlmC with PRC-barrel domain